MKKNNGNGEKYQEALSRAQASLSLTNYPMIYQYFGEKGIPEDEIKPRENVFTFAAWKALNRYVKKGEHGCKILTFITGTKEIVNEESGEIEHHNWKKPWNTVVFHVSQTQAY